MRFARAILVSFLVISFSACSTIQKATAPENLRAESIKSCFRKNGDWDYEHNYCKYNPYKNAGDNEWKEQPKVSAKDKLNLPPLWR